MFDVVIISILYWCVPDVCGLQVYGIGPLSLFISFCVHFLFNLIQRIKFFVILLVSFISSYSNNSTFRRSFLISFLLLPISLAFIFTSALFSAPLMPILTLPIIIMSFPRPKAFWPSLLTPKSHSETSDSFYYQQALPAIAKCISYSSRIGAYSARPGTTLLVRFQDRLSIVRHIEKGHNYSLIQVQGLELQETSCHTAEATSIDDIRDTLYSDSSRRSINRYPLHQFHPVDVSVGRVYSDARSSLTGIIDNYEALVRFSDNLYKALVWVFVSNTNVIDAAVNTSNSISTRAEVSVGSDSTSSVISPSHVRIKSAKVHPLSINNGVNLPTTVPFTDAQLLDALTSFPSNWFDHVIAKYGWNRSPTVTETLKNVIAACYTIMDVPAFMSNTSLFAQTQPSHIYRRFCGDLSFLSGARASECRDWFQENKNIENLVNKAYRSVTMVH